MPAILVVEDDAFLRELLWEVLAEEGYRVRTAADGDRAVAAIADEVPDLVIADVRLPHGDVHAVPACVTSRLPPVPLVLMSGSPPPPELAGLPFLRKPFDIDDLLTIVALSLPK
jgi:DNA-binding NtrC family response regulator